MSKRTVIGIHIFNRMEEVPQVQRLLTEYGCNIKTRLGLHQIADDSCSTSGLLILEMCGDQEKISEMETKMTQLPGVNVQKMVFEE